MAKTSSGAGEKDRKQAERADRLARALRDNLRRRKGQSRARSDSDDTGSAAAGATPATDTGGQTAKAEPDS